MLLTNYFCTLDRPIYKTFIIVAEIFRFDVSG